MAFDSFDKLFQHYKNYGNKMGFEIIVRTSKKGDDGEVRFATNGKYVQFCLIITMNSVVLPKLDFSRAIV